MNTDRTASASTAPLSPSQTRELLAKLGHSPRKPLGQNFLVDANIVRKSLELAAVGPGDVVVEIGPGLGTLTVALLAAGAEVFAVERDPVLARHLRWKLAADFPGKFHLIEGDAMKYPLAGLGMPTPASAWGNAASSAAAANVASSRDFKIVANLPYAISTPWMDAVLESAALPAMMVVMLQREAAERFTARPGDGKTVGAISVALDAAFTREPGHKVAPTCFFPPPRVDSFLLRLRRREAPRRLRPEARRIMRGLFLHRRKQLGSLVKNYPGGAPEALQSWLVRLPEWGLTTLARPEAVPFEAWHALDAMTAECGKI